MDFGGFHCYLVERLSKQKSVRNKKTQNNTQIT